MARRFAAPHPDRLPARNAHHVLVGWTHHSLTNGLALRLERTRSMVALENEQLETEEVLMTRNQALLLGRYLIEAAGYDMPQPAGHRRLRGLLRGWMRRRS